MTSPRPKSFMAIIVGLMVCGFSLQLSGQSCTTATCNAATASRADVLAALPSPSNTNPTVVVNIPSGTSTWTSALNYTIPSAVTNLTIQGATSINCTGTAGQSSYGCTATDSTVITDGFTPNGQNHLIQITTGSASTNFRWTGITIKPIANAAKNDGLLVIGGNSQNIRIDHNHIDENGQTDSMLEMVGNTSGVADHNLFDLGSTTSVGNGFRDFASSDGVGNQAWANATGWGTTAFWYLESNVFNGGSPTDCYNGARLVVRYNTIHNIYVMALHGTKNDAGSGRSCRATEIYHNYAYGSPNTDAIVGQNGGTSLIWANNLASGFNRFNVPGAPRNFVGGDSGTSPWGGMCGTTVRSAAGQSSTDPWDGNSSSSTGYPCLDGVGRGQGDLISIGSPAWPHQYLEPEYAWMNTLAAANEGAINDVSSQFNRDVYPDCGNAGSACSGSFNGTQGTGYGLHSARPATCTAGPGGTYGTSPTGSYGVGYWEIDTNTFFVCDGAPANHWQPIYTPLTYPHPLVSGGGVSLTVSTSGTGSGSVSGTSCSTGSYTSGTSVGACTATPSTGSHFTGWTATGSSTCTGTGTCGPFSLTATTTLTAAFALDTHTLSITATNGTVSGTNCSNGTYNYGTNIGACTATPNAGYTFTGWSGTGSGTACSGTGTCTFSLAADSTLTASFALGSYTLSTATAGTGTGTVTGCAGSYNFGDAYSCTVTATGGSALTSVTGCGGSGTTTYAGTMPASNCTVTATFTAPLICGDPSQLSPNFSGTYTVPPTTLPMTVGFTSPTAGCAMHYTSDGSTPTCSSTAYPGGNISISSVGTYTYRVIACQTGYTSSTVVGGTWTVNSASTVQVTLSGTQTLSGQGTIQ